jgi:rhodanese-related sulfurtransferase
MAAHAPKAEVFDQFARIGKALASGRRLEMIEFLAQRERSVDELARLCGLSVANASQHLQCLRAAGLVEARKEGLRVLCRLSDPRVFALWRSLRQVGERRLAEVERLVHGYREARDTLEALSLPELKRRMKEGRVVLLDVRPAEEFAAGHIPGARNIPLAALKKGLASLPKGRQVVAYCRGPYCLLSDDAVALLRAAGREAVRLEQGFPDWRAQGGPVAQA